ncbi:MAG: hypothetical protein EP330_12540 [Deltaproteobacteria bacterium]|nr:MAG: hypothetical protein EP330_12540 [Deltaproteobacteria bacterium]
MTRLTATAALLAMLSGCDHGFRDPSREFGPEVSDDAPMHRVEIHHPTTLGVADTPVTDAAGRPIGVACETCHGPTPDLSWAASPERPESFHEAVDLRHGTLNCNTCHDSEDRTQLHLADGALLDIEDAMTLCAQCHGVQFRDYRRGSHGGMNGYWDLRRGPRDRNHCVDCHAPHTPAYEPVLPVHPPRDRYLETTEAHPAEGGH